MGTYRIVIPYGGAAGDDSGHVYRFSGELECNSTAEARRAGISAFRELAVATGFQSANPPQESDVFIEEIDVRLSAPLEICALEVAKGVFCMRLMGPLEGQMALRLDRESYRLQRLGAKKLAIDCGQVHPLGSAGLGVLLGLHDRMDVRLVRMPANARETIKVLGLDASMAFFDSFSAALT